MYELVTQKSPSQFILRGTFYYYFNFLMALFAILLSTIRFFSIRLKISSYSQKHKATIVTTLIWLEQQTTTV